MYRDYFLITCYLIIDIIIVMICLSGQIIRVSLVYMKHTTTTVEKPSTRELQKKKKNNEFLHWTCRRRLKEKANAVENAWQE